MNPKPKIAFYGCSSCGGCDASLIDMATGLIDIAKRCDLIFWPTVLDFRYRDVEILADGDIDFTLINGAVRDSEDLEIAGLLRRKSRRIIAHGACAQLGGVIGLANFFATPELIERAYGERLALASPDQGENSCHLTDRVMPLHRVFPVDAVIPGCPPSPDRLYSVIQRLLDVTPLPAGHVFADSRALCATCSRRATLPTTPRIDRFVRLHEKQIDPKRCFLDQGVVCLGPSTRGGCDGQCIRANMPCRGCFGPADPHDDSGGRSLSFLAAWIRATDSEGILATVNSLPDPAGLFYRYGLADSVLRGRIEASNR